MLRKLAGILCLLTCLLQANAALAESTKAAQEAAIAQSAPRPPEYPVLFGDIRILSVSTSPVASLSPEKRAALIRQNIQAFADGNADTQSLQVATLPEGLGIGNGENVLLIITPQDAELAGKPVQELADETLLRIQSTVKNYRTRSMLKTYGLGAALTVLSAFGLWFALHWNNVAFAWVSARVRGKREIWKGGIRFKNIQVLSARQIERSVLLGIGSMRIAVMLLCWYLFLPLILSFFPETRKLGAKFIDYLIAPFATIFHAVIHYIPNLLFIFVIGVIAFYSLKVIAWAFRLIEEGKLKFDWFYEDWARPTYQIVRFLVVVTALISAYPYIPGSSSQAFQGVGLVLGAIISFASSSAISNIVAGIILTYTRAFRLNDRIKVGEAVGDVVAKTLLVTRVRTIKHEVVTIPNSLVMGAQIINYSTSADEEEGLILHTSVTIGYDVPHKKVQALLVDAALATRDLLHEPAPFVLQTSLDDFYVSYEINAYTREPERMALIYSDLHQHILEKFDAAGVEIMSPHYQAVRDGNAAAVPSVLEQEGYEAPAFRVRQTSD